jgi:hypothetical protein
MYASVYIKVCTTKFMEKKKKKKKKKKEAAATRFQGLFISS